MRNMAFWLTRRQMYLCEKDVTRRLAWWGLKAGDKLMAVEKGQGIKKGELVRIGPILILDVSTEPLDSITQQECAREGFPDIRPNMFVDMFMRHMKCVECHIVNRIEFKPLYEPKKAYELEAFAI